MALMCARCARFSCSIRLVIWNMGPRIQASKSCSPAASSFQSTSGRKWLGGYQLAPVSLRSSSSGVGAKTGP